MQTESDTRLAGSDYQSYLIRLWRDGDVGEWRASAQAVVSGEIVRFATLSALYAFLTTRTQTGFCRKEPQQNHRSQQRSEGNMLGSTEEENQ